MHKYHNKCKLNVNVKLGVLALEGLLVSYCEAVEKRLSENEQIS